MAAISLTLQKRKIRVDILLKRNMLKEDTRKHGTYLEIIIIALFQNESLNFISSLFGDKETQKK